MSKEEFHSPSKDLEEMQKKLCVLLESFQAHSKIVSFMKSPVGQYLDRHPFLALTLLVFVSMSAIPVGFFLLLVVLTSLAAFVGVILLEGLVISVGGLSLLCVLCGLCFVSFVLSGTGIVSYVVTSRLINYWFSPKHRASDVSRGATAPLLSHSLARRENLESDDSGSSGLLRNTSKAIKVASAYRAPALCRASPYPPDPGHNRYPVTTILLPRKSADLEKSYHE